MPKKLKVTKEFDIIMLFVRNKCRLCKGMDFIGAGGYNIKYTNRRKNLKFLQPIDGLKRIIYRIHMETKKLRGA